MSYTLLLQGETIVAGMVCDVEAWNSTQQIFSQSIKISKQTIIHLEDLKIAIQVMLTNCQSLPSMLSYESFPSVFTVSSEDIATTDFSKHSIFFRPSLQLASHWTQNLSNYVKVIIVALSVISFLVVFMSKCVPNRKQKKWEYHPPSNALASRSHKMPKACSISDDTDSTYSTKKSSISMYTYEPPVRLASKMSDEDKKLLYHAFHNPAMKPYSRDEVTTPEDAEELNAESSASDNYYDIDDDIRISSDIEYAFIALRADWMESGEQRCVAAGDASIEQYTPFSQSAHKIAASSILNWAPLKESLNAGVISEKEILHIFQLQESHKINASSPPFSEGGLDEDEEIIIEATLFLTLHEFYKGSMLLQNLIDCNCKNQEVNKRTNADTIKISSPQGGENEEQEPEQEELLTNDNSKNKKKNSAVLVGDGVEVALSENHYLLKSSERLRSDTSPP